MKGSERVVDHVQVTVTSHLLLTKKTAGEQNELEHKMSEKLLL